MEFFGGLNRFMYQACGYFWYLLTARHRWGYGLHSPFMYDFCRQVLWRSNREALFRVRSRVRALKKDTRMVACPDDPGAGSAVLSSDGEPVGRIVGRSSVSYKYGKVLYAAARVFNPSTILELGASVGISTMYLCEGAPQADVYTIEACREKLAVCRENARLLGHDHLHPVQGSFAKVVPGLLRGISSPDIVFIDGDHRKDKVLEYFEQIVPHLQHDSLVIFDDIHWSKEMTRAWEILTTHPGVKVSVDLFRVGILLFRRELSPQRFKIAY